MNSIKDAFMFMFDAKENEINREYKFKHNMNNLLKYLDPFKKLKYVLSVINYYYNDNGLHVYPLSVLLLRSNLHRFTVSLSHAQFHLKTLSTFTSTTLKWVQCQAKSQHTQMYLDHFRWLRHVIQTTSLHLRSTRTSISI